jgi:diphthine-ammonia ligase
VKRTTKGEKENELQDLQELLHGLPIDGVISGAIASEYQRTRIERVCDELGIKSFTPLWHKKPEILLRDQLHAGFQSMIVGVFANGFNDTWLGTMMTEETIQKLLDLQKRFGINAAGEGGEFETLVLDGPIFTKRLVIDETEKVWRRDSGVLQVKRAHLQNR